MKDATAFVLAGGRSSRMRADKALLLCGEETLLQRSLRIAADVCDSVLICGSRKRYGAYGEVVEDLHPGCGPLSGIQSALHVTRTELNLILSVDMPLMESSFLRWLLSEARRGEQLVTVPEANGRPQPLCAVYRKQVEPAAAMLLAASEYKVSSLFRQVPTRIVREAEVAAGGFLPGLFTNVNTPEEYESALARTALVSGEKKIS